jgi:hypothetical protein
MSFHKNLSQWGRWAALAPKLLLVAESDDESIGFSHMRDITGQLLRAKQASRRHDTSPLLKLEISNAFTYLPTSHILPPTQDSYKSTTTHQHLPHPPTKPAFRLLRAALISAIPKHLAN